MTADVVARISNEKIYNNNDEYRARSWAVSLSRVSALGARRSRLAVRGERHGCRRNRERM